MVIYSGTQGILSWYTHKLDSTRKSSETFYPNSFLLKIWKPVTHTYLSLVLKLRQRWRHGHTAWSPNWQGGGTEIEKPEQELPTAECSATRGWGQVRPLFILHTFLECSHECIPVHVYVDPMGFMVNGESNKESQYCNSVKTPLHFLEGICKLGPDQ